MFNTKKIAVLQEKVNKLEKEVEMLDKKYAIKLVERIVFGFLALALTAMGTAWIADITGVLEKLV